MAAASSSAITCASVTLRLRASSWDTNPSSKPIPFTIPSKKKKKPLLSSEPALVLAPSSTSQPLRFTPPKMNNNNAHVHPRQQGSLDELYLGYERWLPAAPKVKSPRSIYNAASLAYIGDCIYELYARRHFLFPPSSIDVYNDRVMAIVRCESQDALLKKLLDDDYLSEEERDILRWGKNIVSGKRRTIKRAGVAVYNRASSLETLVGYLYLTDVQRLEDLMFKLGFSTGASSDLILPETS
ncbi:hypothetical protein QJS10_CPA08g00495 [Acorus calamus]|uniref:RNase III domain-containing protein n=1 Tax=Acorus calamus TaxID=4465 RepID=A0AAV9EC59_ACOCL|nr:hypothetical protein QJS10_CPA08g00495 [Acorus calamus]